MGLPFRGGGVRCIVGDGYANWCEPYQGVI